MKIILIDDDESTHVYHKLMIESAGIALEDVNIFYAADEALTYLKELDQDQNKVEWPDYIFVDINMHAKSGFEFVADFDAQNFSMPQPLIYMVSSSENPYDVDRVNNIPIVKGFLTKFIQKEFFEQIKKDGTSKL